MVVVGYYILRDIGDIYTSRVLILENTKKIRKTSCNLIYHAFYFKTGKGVKLTLKELSVY